MEVLVLDTNFESVTIIDTFKSMIWTDRYDAYGDFEIQLPVSAELFNYLKPDYYLWSRESDHTMIIEDLTIETDTEEGNYLIVTGRSLESILDRRIVWGQRTLTGNLQNGIKALLTESIISPSVGARRISNFIFAESDDPKITSLTMDNQYAGDDLYSIINTLCVENKIGFKVVLNENNQFVFSLYAGADRSYNQIENPYVVFSPNFDNIIESNYFTSKATYKNVTMVAGEGEWPFRTTLTIGTGSGLERREVFTDAGDLSRNTEEATLTYEEYEAKLRSRGYDTLADCPISLAFEGEVEATQIFKYGKDFFVGDTVQITNEYGQEGTVYISELVISQSNDAISIIPTFKAI